MVVDYLNLGDEDSQFYERETENGGEAEATGNTFHFINSCGKAKKVGVLLQSRFKETLAPTGSANDESLLSY